MYLEQKYLRLLSSRLRNFKDKGGDVYNWSCHVCGDSAKKKSKARAYAYMSGNKFRWTCHNCSAGGAVRFLIKSLDEDLFRHLCMEEFEDSDRGREVERERRRQAELDAMARKAAVAFQDDPTDALERVSALDPDHPAQVVVRSRMIPRERWDDLFHAEGFYAFAHSVIPEKYEDTGSDEPRLVIPVRREGRLIGFQGRSYRKVGVKYITACIDKEPPFLYGLDGVRDGAVYAVEGPIDSMFLRNGVASCGGVIQRELHKAGLPRDRCVIVYDNEPRNVAVVKNMEKAVADGWRVVVWPDSVRGKDINVFALSGMTRDVIHDMMERNTFSGMEAELRIIQWRKC